MCELGNGTAFVHVRRVAARAEDASNLGLRVCVRRGDQRACGVVDQGGDFDRKTLSR